jgi:DNA-binding MarR family transcriptional regulator
MASNNTFGGDFTSSNIKTYQAGVLQAAAHRAVTKLTNKALKKFNISAMQWFIIGTVLDAGDKGIRSTDLAKIMGTNLPFLTNTIAMLASKGMLQKESHGTDNRASLISVAPSFLAQSARIETELREVLRNSIYSQVTPAQLSTYIMVLSKLRQA